MLCDGSRRETMKQQRQQRHISQHIEWKRITVWLLAAVLAVTMSMPVTAFAAGTVGADRLTAAAAVTVEENTLSGTADRMYLSAQGDEIDDTTAAGQTNVPGAASQADLATPTDPTDPTEPIDQADLAAPIDPTDAADLTGQADPATPTTPTDPTDPTDPPEPQYFSVYRIEVDDSGVMTCWWYDEAGMKSEEPEKDRHFIVAFDKGSKTEGTAKEKVGKTGTLYYFNKNGKGKKYTGWFKQKSKKYYFKKGKRFKGVKKVKKTWYEFSGKNGQLLRKIGDSVDKKIQPYSSSTSYMIILKLSERKVRIYKGKKNNWKRIHKYTCTVGAPSTPTVKGTFAIGTKGRYFDAGTGGRCWYYTQFYGNYLFHSIIYDRSSSPVHVLDGRLGIRASHGCVRLALKNAKWIYYNIPRGTKVVIY